MQAAARVAVNSRASSAGPHAGRHLRVVRRQGNLQHLFTSFVTAVVIVAALLALNVAQRVLIAQQAIEMDRLERSIRRERMLQEGLLTQAKVLRSPERVARIAVRELAMRKPAGVRYIYLPASLLEESKPGSSAAGFTGAATSVDHGSAKRSRNPVSALLSTAGHYLASILPGTSDAQAARN